MGEALADGRTLTEWTAHVAAALYGPAADPVAAGARLAACRDACARGDYARVLDRLRMRSATADKLIRAHEEDEALRVTAALADPTIKVDPAAQEAFKREAALHGVVYRIERYFRTADPEFLASEIEPIVAKYVAGQLRPLLGRLAGLLDLLEARRAPPT